ncbi:MAG: glycosyl transferase family 1 [Chloroflexi bacterium RBG_16_48_7]|nr:MAG: glycosyl transferase family 1 [Chloroflexi bacterium RBG_16_48_7]
MKIEDYEAIVGKSTIDELRFVADKLKNKIMQNVNSTFSGGGVAEILDHMIPLLNQLGLDARWDVIRGNAEFFEVTKKFHNALHGNDAAISITPEDYSIFNETSRKNIDELNLKGDIFLIHDPQPIALIAKKKEVGGSWIWRCHIDVSNPDRAVWGYLRKYILQYNAAVFSAPNFAQQLPIRQFMISPSIDPVSEKNREISQEIINSVLEKYQLNTDKPIILQVSRFDYLKDPVGVIKAFNIVKKSYDCQLVLAGGTATDDPESTEVIKTTREFADGIPDVHILEIPPKSDIEINALQRAATIVMQKSIKEGFGLTISEALWKSKPVVASAVGGIPLQIKNKLTGLLCHSIEGAAVAVKQLLGNPDYASWLGNNGKEHVRQNFLITRHVKDYLLLCLAIKNAKDVIYL